MNNKELLKNIFKNLKPYKVRFALAGIALILVVLCMLLLGYAIKHFIDNGFGVAENNNSMFQILLLTTIFGIASFFRSYIINSTAEFAANDIKLSAYRSLLTLNSKQIDSYSFNDLATRINNDTDNISRVIIDSTSFFLRNAMTTIGGIIMMFTCSPKLSTIAFLIITLITLLAVTLSKKVRELAKNAENAKSKINSFVLETIINNKIINAYSKQSNLLSYFEKLNLEAKQKIIERLKARSLFFASVITSMLLTIFSIIWYGSIEVSNGNITPGTLASFLFYAFMTATSFGGIMEMLNDQQKNLANCERVFEIIELKNSESEIDKKITLPTSGLIELKEISYSYNSHNSNQVIDNLNISFPIGKFTAITGKSGKGKTTLLNLLMGLYKYDSGFIKIAEETYNHITPKMWDQKLAYVAQDNILFSGTILENISFFNHKINQQEIDFILHKLELSPFINSLDKGLNSELANMASKISGGQKQRLAIARAMIAKPDILILDEATSQLDEATEEKVLDFVKEMMKGKTVICVAHRRGAINKSDIKIAL